MTIFHYSVFMVCLFLLNGTVLYSYFIMNEHKKFNEIHNTEIRLSLKNVYLIQAFFFLIGSAVLCYFAKNDIWFSDIRFFPFLGLAVLCGLLGKLEDSSKKQYLIIGSISELAAITGFVFMLPEKEWMTDYFPSAEIGRLTTGAVWFAVYKFFGALCDRFKGIIVIQSLHIGFIALGLVYFSGVLLSFLQLAGILFPVMLLTAPLYCVYRYDLPLSGSTKNIFCLIITGLVFFTVPLHSLGIGCLMISYVLFEIITVFFRFIFSLFKKEKLFFCECLLEKTQSPDVLVSIVIRYNILIAGFVFLSVYLNTQIQFVLLSAILYVKLYLKAIEGETSNGSLFDLIKGAKETAKLGYKETAKTFSELKNMHIEKEKRNKDASDNEQS